MLRDSTLQTWQEYTRFKCRVSRPSGFDDKASGGRGGGGRITTYPRIELGGREDVYASPK